MKGSREMGWLVKGQGETGLCFEVLCLRASGDDPMERANFMMQKREGAILGGKSLGE